SSAASHRREQHDHIVDRAAERRADQDPKCSRQESKLRRQHRTNQWSWTCNRSEMMAENHPAIRWHKIFPIISYNRRRGVLLLEHEHFGPTPSAVEAVRKRGAAKSGHDDPERTDLLT